MSQLSTYNAETRTGTVFSAVNGEELFELREMSFEEFHRIGRAVRRAEKIARESAISLARGRVDRVLSEMEIP